MVSVQATASALNLAPVLRGRHGQPASACKSSSASRTMRARIATTGLAAVVAELPRQPASEGS
jgi:hypothetical protein